MVSHGEENEAFESELEESNRIPTDSSTISGPDLLVNANYIPKYTNPSTDLETSANHSSTGSLPPEKLDTYEGNDEFEDNRCGFGSFSPKWVQRFATKKVFVIVFTILGIIQGMTASYYNATISTIEKRFKISSQTTGIIMAGNEISQILFSLILSYYGGKGHRPRWIAASILISAISCFLLASPHILYGSGDDALALTKEYANVYDKGSIHSEFFNQNHNDTASTIFGNKKKVTLCQKLSTETVESCVVEEASIVPLILMFMSQFVGGIGVLIFVTLGAPYLDDNIERENIPMVFGVTMSLRSTGPTLGYIIASGTLKLFVNPLLNPLISSMDPRWIGAWWLGWVIFGIVMLFMSFLIALFPRTLHNSSGCIKTRKPVQKDMMSSISEIPRAVKALLKNKVNVYCKISGIFYAFAGVGYWTYMPKYMETIFMQSASEASIISGAVGILPLAAGMTLSGFLISKFRFSARKIQGWNCFVGLVFVIVTILFTQIGCDVGKISFGTESSDGSWNLTSTCNTDCHCKTSRILPVCHKEENTVYYSACHAGCTYDQNDRIGNCSCIPYPEATVTLGNCAEGCGRIFTMFLAISAFIKFLDATSAVGGTLISFRCVSLDERSLSIGLGVLLISGLSMLPSPIVFGRIIDNVCLVWDGSSCGKRGNCMLYDGQQLRYIFNLTAAAFSSVGLFFDFLVFYYSKGMDLYAEPDFNNTQADNTEKSSNRKSSTEISYSNQSTPPTSSMIEE